MKILFVVLAFITILSILPTFYSNDCDKIESAKKFKTKILDNQFPFYETDPYLNQTEIEKQRISNIIKNKEIVCAIKYTNENKTNYVIK
jgi:hypothetical protein